MANSNNLKPFKKGSDPRRNTSGANADSITKYLREFGKSRCIHYNIEITSGNNQVRTIKGKVSGKGKNGQINQLIATQLLTKAIKGDLRAIQEVLDRTEGKPKQGIELTDLNDLDITIEYFGDD
jgi:hypothetical protein